jgi:ribonuclease D
VAQRIHDSLRVWRAGRARELGVPAYRVLTNRQLVALARSRPSEPGALLAIEGIGPATARVHGEAIVRRIRDALDSAAGVPVGVAASGAA